jgi:hypothetical protein
MPYSVVFNFSCYGSTWHEQWYSNAVPLNAAALASDIATLGAPGRALAFRQGNCILQSVSVRDVVGTRKSALIELDQDSPNSTTQAHSPDLAGAAARVTINCVDQRPRNMWLRGLDDSQTIRQVGTGQTNQSPLSNMINTYLNNLRVNYNAATRVLTPVPSPPAPNSGFSWQPITTFAASPDNPAWTRVSFSSLGVVPRPVAGLTSVYFRGLESPRFLYLRGRFLALSVGLTGALAWFDIAARYRDPQALAFAPNTMWRFSEYTYSNWTPGPYVYVLATRDTAGPTGRRRGRRSAIIRRR